MIKLMAGKNSAGVLMVISIAEKYKIKKAINLFDDGFTGFILFLMTFKFERYIYFKTKIPSHIKYPLPSGYIINIKIF